MAVDPGYFQITNPTQCNWLGGFTAKNGAELKNGILVKRNSDNTLEACAANEKPEGFAYSERTLIYTPVSPFLDAGEVVTLVTGHVNFLAGQTFFDGGTLPEFGALLYTHDAGSIAVSGSATGLFGKVVGTTDVRAAPNATDNVVECEAHFAPV